MGKSDAYTGCPCRLAHIMEGAQKTEEKWMAEDKGNDHRNKVKAMDNDKDNAEVPLGQHMEC